jgi:hypothetical protein
MLGAGQPKKYVRYAKIHEIFFSIFQTLHAWQLKLKYMFDV